MALRGYTIAKTMPMAQMARKLRRPEHTFQLRMKPFAITPFLIAPVIPGETLKNLMWQARVVTDPIKAPLVGWWLEYYFFYVKHRDLAERDTLTTMMLNPGVDVTGIDDPTSDRDFYHAGTINNINWAKLCTIRCVQEYFRNDGETWNQFMIGSLPAAQINGNTWLDSLITDTVMAVDDVEVEGTDVNTTIQASEIDRAMRQWEWLRMQNLMSLTYEEYLMSYGISQPSAEEHKPELIRYSRTWQYPSDERQLVQR